MLDHPLISIIVPNYNHEKFLKQRLNSIFNQTYQNFEVILLDDCSKDNSRVILLEYAKRAQVSHCIFNEKNSGNTFYQWRKGIALAKGEYIWIAESDDFCAANFLEKISKPLLKNNQVVLSYCQSNRVNEYGEIIGNWKEHTDSLDVKQFQSDFVLEGNLFIERYLIYLNAIPNASAVLLKKEHLKILDDLISNIYLKSCGDWVLYLQQICNYKIAFTADSLNSFRFHSSSVIATAIKIENRISIIEINLQMRKVMLSFLRKKIPINYNEIISNNKNIIKSLKYEKGMILMHNNKRYKGTIILLGVFDELFKRYKLKKKIFLKLKKLFS